MPDVKTVPIAQDLRELYAAAAAWRHERGSQPLFGSGTVEVMIERISRAEDRERMAVEALERIRSVVGTSTEAWHIANAALPPAHEDHLEQARR